MAEKQIYLQLAVKKGGEETDNGDFVFEVEASNEELDLENQIVLQKALLDSKDYFLANGVISYEHGHIGGDVRNDNYVIGEPIGVRADGKSTIVKGKLYKNIEKAKVFIDLLKAGSTRVKASVGGKLLDCEVDQKTGVTTVKKVLWGDLALTTAPVNYTVSSAQLVKALKAGGGTEHKDFTGGRALVTEDINSEVIEDKTIQKIREALEKEIDNGNIKTRKEAILYLTQNPLGGRIKRAQAKNIVLEYIKRGDLQMKKSFAQKLKEAADLFKSLGVSDEKEGATIKKNSKDSKGCEDCEKSEDAKEGEEKDKKKKDVDTDDIDIDLDEDSEDSDLEDDLDDSDLEDDDLELESKDKEEEKDKKPKKEKAVNGTRLLKALLADNANLKKALQDQQEMLEAMGGVVTDTAKVVAAMGAVEQPVRSILSKAFGTKGSDTKVEPPLERPTQGDLETAQDSLHKACMEGRVTFQKASMIMSDMQKCIRTGRSMNAEYYDILNREVLRAQEQKQ